MLRGHRFQPSQFDGWLIHSSLAADLRFRLICYLDLMLTRQLVLLLVGAVHYVAVRTAITKTSAPYMWIIKNSGVCGTIHQTPMYGFLEFVFGAKGG